MTATGRPALAPTTPGLFSRLVAVELDQMIVMPGDHGPFRVVVAFAGAITWRRWVRQRLGPTYPEDFAHDVLVLADRVTPVLPIGIPLIASPTLRALAAEGLRAAFARARHPQSATPA